jgi:hypothetical protein
LNGELVEIACAAAALHWPLQGLQPGPICNRRDVLKASGDGSRGASLYFGKSFERVVSGIPIAQ